MTASKSIFLQQENMPCYYELSFDAAKPALIVRIHQDFLAFAPSLEKAYFVENFQKTFNFSNFQSDWDKDAIGFNGCFKKKGVKDDFLVFSVEIPPLEIFLMKQCEYCQGRKEDLLFGGICLVCNGAGQVKKTKPCHFCADRGEPYEHCHICQGSGTEFEVWMDHQSLYAISATFTVLFSLLSFGQVADKFVASKKSQLLSVETSTIKGMGGCPVYGVLAAPFVDWLRKFAPDSHFHEVEDGIGIVWDTFHGKRSFRDIDKFTTWCQVRNNGWLSISVPGDRTGIYPASNGFGVGDDLGYEFSCHNMDNPRQQLAILSALAMLCDKFRKETES